jgi:predicted GNAT superfamily acetyltransferase
MTSAGEIASGQDAVDLDAGDRPELSPAAGAAATRNAVAAAGAAARAAGVRIRTVTELAELDAVYRLYDAIWRPDPKNPPVTTELLRALTKAGNYVGGAFDGADLVGACVGFFSAPAGTAMHSHVAGVGRAAMGRSVGFALKLHQRAWAIQRGVSEIAWTFDPLVSRNAYFNLAKLAARPAEYLPNFYGGMNDGINGTGDTDRLLVRWNLHAPDVIAACAGSVKLRSAADERARGAAVALARSADGGPEAGSVGAATLLVAVPPDVEALRTTDPSCAQEWRLATREVLGGVMADGGAIAGFDRTGWYIVTRQPASEERGQ